MIGKCALLLAFQMPLNITIQLLAKIGVYVAWMALVLAAVLI